MTTPLTYLTDQQNDLLRESISRVVELADPEKIICFGARHQTKAWTALGPSLNLPGRSDFDLLIIPAGNHKFKDHELLDQLDKLNTAHIHLTCIIHSFGAIHTALQQGNRFFQAVCLHGWTLHDTTGLPFPAFPNASRSPHDAILWESHFDLASQFLSGAAYFQSADHLSMAAFMLHQAVEQACIAVIYSRLGYRASTHNLHRLLALVENISPGVTRIFQPSAGHNAGLFDQLARAYGDVRYNNAFTINADDIRILYACVKDLFHAIIRLHDEQEDVGHNYDLRGDRPDENMVREVFMEFPSAVLLPHPALSLGRGLVLPLN